MSTSRTRRWSCEGDRHRPAEGRHPRSAGRCGPALAAQARLRRVRHARRPRDRPRARRRRPGGCSGTGRAHVLRAPRQPADRELRDPSRTRDGRASSSPSSPFPARTTTTTPPGRSARSAPSRCSAWHQDAELPAGTAAVVLPGGFSYGDYLRTGAIASVAPVMDAVRAFAAAGGPVLGICNGFQILCEARLLPGVLRRTGSSSSSART